MYEKIILSAINFKMIDSIQIFYLFWTEILVWFFKNTKLMFPFV